MPPLPVSMGLLHRAYARRRRLRAADDDWFDRKVASVPLIPKFVSKGAERAHELRNWDTGSLVSARTPSVKPPRAAKRLVISRHHAVELVDEFAWLRAENWHEVMEDPSKLEKGIRAHLEAENSYSERMLAGTADLQRMLLEEMQGRVEDDDSAVPGRDGPWVYYSSFASGSEYPRYCRRPRDGGAETVLLDGNREAKGKPFWELEAAVHSPDHKLLAYAVDVKGSELYTVRIRDLATGKNRADVIHDTSGKIVWANDSRTLFYTRLDTDHRPLLVYRHTVGTSAAQDALVYQERDPAFDVSVDKTRSGAFILIESEDHRTSEVRLVDANVPTSPPRVVVPREVGHYYHVEHHGQCLIITTNSGGADDFRICATSLAASDMTGWREIVPHRAGCGILETVSYRGHLVRLEIEDGLPRIVIHRWSDGVEHAVTFYEDAYAVELVDGFEFDTDTIRFTYSSMTTPEQVFDYDMEARTRVLRKTQDIPAGHNSADYVTRRLSAPARDGESVPITLFFHRRTPLDGSAPLALYGYGSYGDGVAAEFSAARLSLVDRGFIFALAHVRGGNEKGHRWYRDGMGENKCNAFTDFIAVAEHLVRESYTRRGRIVAMGESAGGTLVAAAANMAPDLFLAVIADAPFVDVLNTLLDDGLPLTPGDWTEWGNPIASKAAFDLIRSYCPYENIEPTAYPHILACGGLADQRVAYWEPAKWVARLRERKTDQRLLLLKVDMDAGHDGASGRFEELEEKALKFAFAIKVAGMIKAPSSPA
jgi:oligopeptidase B